MSIERFGGQYQIDCDACGETADEYFDDFYEAVAWKKENGWKSVRVNGGWEDHCPNCVNK